MSPQVVVGYKMQEQLFTVFGFELVQDIADVEFDGVFRDEQGGCYLGIASPLHQEKVDLFFRRSQNLGRIRDGSRGELNRFFYCL